ncbi:MAG: hypothetical protein OEY18_06605 [Candidatus Aminicenantes bacterium]|nr:hypothetical protein [Candidatus Aminicenantes bacterium]MDH5742321.1 hypothetical protein [Candidatus Aminicenantes bacterium]
MKRRFLSNYIHILVMAFILALLYTFAQADQTKTLTVNPTRIEQRIERLAKYGKTPEGGVNRVAFSEKDIQSREYMLSLISNRIHWISNSRPGRLAADSYNG